MTREEAIKMLQGMKADNLNLNDLYTRDKYEALVMAIKALEQEPIKGHWIDREVYDADRWKCSECGRTEQYQENFCPNCGADMREVEE